MALVEQLPINRTGWDTIEVLERQLKDYIDASFKLLWQRQAIFIAATVLAVFYFDPAVALSCYAGVAFTEVVDLILARRIKEWDDHDPEKARQYLFLTAATTTLSAAAISLFVTMIALQQHSGGHFTPLFFLFAAALFAAMNNHQLLPALILRLVIYGATFLFIAVIDIWRYRPPLTSDAWLQFFTIVFVLYFVVDCSIVFLRMYRAGLRQLEELRLEHKRTRIAFEAKSQFLSTVSHELRTPLTSIKGSLDLVNAGALGAVPDKMQPVLEIAAKNSKRLATLINDLLDLQKIEAGEMAFQFKPLDACILAREAVEANQGFAKAHAVNLYMAKPTRALMIRGDEERLQQVMNNLLSNAIKFSHKGGNVTVRIDPIGTKVRIAVEDHGIGIPAGDDVKEKVFGKFSQVDASDRRKVGGTGLGMNISRRIIERHAGKIDYTSIPGEGTTFYVDLETYSPSKDEGT